MLTPEPAEPNPAVPARPQAPSPPPPTHVSPTPPPTQDTRSVVARYGSMVYGIALTHTNCQADAEDVFQEVFLAYHRRQPRCRSEDHRQAWLIVTTVNCSKAIALSSWRTRVVPMTVEDLGDATPAMFEFETQDQDAIFRAMARIPEDYRTVLHLYYFEDLPVAQIADALGIEVGAVKMRLSRGRGLMRDRLQGALFNE